MKKPGSCGLGSQQLLSSFILTCAYVTCTIKLRKSIVNTVNPVWRQATNNRWFYRQTEPLDLERQFSGRSAIRNYVITLQPHPNFVRRAFPGLGCLSVVLV